MKRVFLIKEGEIALKGLNKSFFERKLIKNIEKKLKSIGNFNYINSQSVIIIEPIGQIDMKLADQKISKTFGLSSYSIAAVANKNLPSIKQVLFDYLKNELKYHRTFKIESKRSDKKFPINSPEICKNIGEFVLNNFSHLSVDIKAPDITINIEIRDSNAYVYTNKIRGPGGIPTGCSGNGALLISGGIDSPVAGWMMAKRGMSINAIHFMSPPYTGLRALEKVKSLVSVLCKWCGPIPLYCVNFTNAQTEIKNKCPENMFTIVMRRIMTKISEKIIKNINLKRKCDIKTMISGESLGQVASQTIDALLCTNSSNMQILRPLIGMDKLDIVNIAKKIKTFNISTLPYEDCCTVFTPRHPKTKPTFQDVIRAERNLNIDFIIQDALKNTDFNIINENSQTFTLY